MIDTHCHLTYPGLIERIDEVVEAARGAGVGRMITVGTSPDDARRGLELARRFGSVYATVGVHPHAAAAHADVARLADELRELAADPRCVALGEMGLDRHYDEPDFETQRVVLRAQLQVAKQPHMTDRPVILHSRGAVGDVLEELELAGVPGGRCVFPCFTAPDDVIEAETDAVLDYGCMVSFTGIATFNSAKATAAASDRVPLDRLMVETDAPYLTPAPHRKIKPNEPKFVVEVARFLAERRGMSYEAFEAAVDANAVRFFGLDS